MFIIYFNIYKFILVLSIDLQGLCQSENIKIFGDTLTVNVLFLEMNQPKKSSKYG